VGDLTRTDERYFYGDDESQFIDIARPIEDSHGTIVSYHGGYWRDTYGLDLHHPIVDHCVELGWTVVNVEYRRLAPGGPPAWEAMSADVVQAAMLAEEIATGGPLISLGHSAGGHLALWVAAQADTDINAVVALAPVANLMATDERQLSDHVTRQLLGVSAVDEPETYRQASPLHLLPLGIPQLVVHGPADQHVPYEMSADYVDAARSLGDTVSLVNSEGVDHFNVIDPTHRVWRTIDAFLDSQRP